ncbi:MAG: DUF4440 domain-containing protein [Burkholderiaceae bacterium]|nr:DUF4440 domain-containing protein [Burkholderiaceae bacterium]
MSDDALTTLRALECELHQPCVPGSRQRLVELLHPEFQEFGRSGATYTLADLLEHLPAESDPVEVHAQDFAVRKLSDAVVLLTYRSAHVNLSGALERHTLRSSIWLLEASGWQMVFHQGTPTEAFAQNLNEPPLVPRAES